MKKPTNMNKKLQFYLPVIVMLLGFVQGFAQETAKWDGSGTATDPYQIRNSADWATLASEVSEGKVADGTAFRLMGDINATAMVGTSSHHFKGSFDGGGYTITADITTKTEKREVDSLVECAGELTCGKLFIVTNDDERVIEKDGYTINVVPFMKF